MTKLYFLSILTFLYTFLGFASYNDAREYFEKYNVKNQEELFVKLVEAKLYYSSIPIAKNILIKNAGRVSSSVDLALTKLVEEVGVKQFETLPVEYLARAKSYAIRYIIGKKLFRDGKNAQALKVVTSIPWQHAMYPFAKHLEGTILSVENLSQRSFEAFDMCVDASNSKIASAKGRLLRMLTLNRDYCIVGKARSKYGGKKYADAELLYLDLSKNSRVWPEILFEEAWASYYKGDYNRSLGKLVSYKAPIFNYFFNPEVEVLNSLSYFKLCLYSDAKKITEDFAHKYFKDTKSLRRILNSMGKDANKYFSMVYRFEQFGKAQNELLRSLLKNILKEEAYLETTSHLIRSLKELSRIKNNKSNSFTRFLIFNLKESSHSYQKIIGNYVRSRLVSNYASLYKAFEGMSYIKLEVLAQKKAKLYSFDEKDRSRGDIKYVKRNEKQYFWDFNGEFWADELGDYVFALKSEC